MAANSGSHATRIHLNFSKATRHPNSFTLQQGHPPTDIIYDHKTQLIREAKPESEIRNWYSPQTILVAQKAGNPCREKDKTRLASHAQDNGPYRNCR
jgi:hypothetical protein